MSNLLGTVSGQLKVDVSQAVAAYAAARAANASTMTAISHASHTINQVSDAFLGVGIAIAGALGYAADQAAEFNQQMDYFQAVSGATTSQMQQIRAEAIKLDQTTMFSTEDIAKMFVQLSKSGESTSDILDGVAAACTNLAQAAQIPLADATTSLVTIMSAFNLKASDATMVTNELAGASNTSILTVDNLATSMKYVGAVADTLHISLQDTTTALTLMGRAGIVGSQGGTELRQMLISISAPTKAATAEMTKLGIITKNGTNQFFQANGQAKSLGQIFQILQNATSGMGAEQQTAAMKVLFNTRAMAGAEILAKAGAKGFDTMNAAINRTTAADVAAARMDNLQGSIHILTSSLKTMAITAGQPLQNFLNGVVKDVTALVQGFSHLSPSTQSLIIHILAIVAGLALLLGIIGKMISIGLTLWKTIVQLGEAMEFLWGLGESLITMVQGLTVALLENPIVLIVVAVIALAVAFYELYQHCTAFRDIINDIGRWFKSVFEDVVKWFMKVPGYFEDGWNDIKKAFDTGINWIKSQWDKLTGFITGPVVRAFDKLGDIITNTIPHFFEQMYNDAVGGIEKFLKAFVEELPKLPDQIAYWLGFALGRMTRWEIEVVVWAYKVSWEIVQAIVSFFMKLPGMIMDFVDRMGTDLIGFFMKLPGEVMKYGDELFHDWLGLQEDILSAAEKWGMDLLNAVVGFFEKLPGYIEKYLNDAFFFWLHFEEQLFISGQKLGIDFVEVIVGFFEKLPGEAWRQFVNVTNAMDRFAGSMIQKAGNLGSTVVNAISGWISQLPGLMGTIMTNVINTVTGWIGKAFDAAKNFAGSLWNGFKKGLGINSPSFIEKQMTQISNCMDTETQKINKYVKQIQGLGSKLQGNNPALTASQYNQSTMTALSNNLNSQLRQLSVSGAVSVPGFSTQSTSAYGQGGSNGQPTKVLEVNVFNPTAESAASSTTKQLQTLSQLGAF